MSVKDDFPIRVRKVPFTSYSYFSTNAAENCQQQQKKKRNILIGGCNSVEGGFYEFIVNDKANCIKYKSFENDYGKKFSNLKHIGFNRASNSQSYLVKNDKYMIMFYREWYNVYDMEHDTWLIDVNDENDKLLSTVDSPLAQSVLINDQILIISHWNRFDFYFVGNSNITNPILMHEHHLQTKCVFFSDHEICVIGLTKEAKDGKDGKDENGECNKHDETYKIKILAFGGGHINQDFLSSFLILDILLSYSFSGDKLSSQLISVDEHLIDESCIKLSNMDQLVIKRNRKDGFRSTCVLNNKNETTVIMFGGETNGKDVHLFNCVTYELTRFEQV